MTKPLTDAELAALGDYTTAEMCEVTNTLADALLGIYASDNPPEHDTLLHALGWTSWIHRWLQRRMGES